MSNDTLTTAISNFGLPELQSTNDPRIKTALISGQKFRFVRKTARERTAMLVRAAPLTTVIGDIFKAVKGPAGELIAQGGMDSLQESDKLELGSIVVTAVTQSFSNVDPDRLYPLVDELIGWADHYDETTEKFMSLKEPIVYERVFDANLSAQIPVALGVVSANFLDSILKEVGGST